MAEEHVEKNLGWVEAVAHDGDEGDGVHERQLDLDGEGEGPEECQVSSEGEECRVSVDFHQGSVALWKKIREHEMPWQIEV